MVRLWRYRRILLAAAILGAVATAVVYFTSPTHRMTSLRFDLMFRGAETDTYPSGKPFSPEHVIARSALRETYDQNDLGQYGTFDQFAHALHVAPRASAEMIALDALYAGKLSNRRLTVVDQKHLEREYESKRLALLAGLTYELKMDLSGPLADLPDDLHDKVLRGVLETWSTQAVQLRGALNCSPPVLTTHALPATILDAPPLLAADILRQKAHQILDAVDALARVPGARTCRSSGDKPNLDELRSTLNDVVGAEILPTIQLLCLANVPNTTALQQQETLAYVQSAFQQARRMHEQARDATEALKSAYVLTQRLKTDAPPAPKDSSATVTIPQLGESFIDRLLDLAAESESKNARFRQEYCNRIAAAALTEIGLARDVSFYQDTLDALQAPLDDKNAPAATSADDLAARAKKRISDAHAALLAHSEQINAIQTLVASSALGEPAQLYTAPQPTVTSYTRDITTTRALLILIALVGGLVFLASCACLYHDRIRTLKQNAA